MDYDSMSPKSRRAEEIMRKTGLWNKFDLLVARCWRDAYGMDPYKYQDRFLDEIAEEKSGTISIFEHSHSLSANNFNACMEEDRIAFNCFENGFHSRIKYHFTPPHDLTLHIHLKDKYITKPEEKYSLITIAYFGDYSVPWPKKIESYTQPFIDCEDDILQTLLWHELQR